MIAPFVDLAWLAAHRGEVVLADVRWYLDDRSGRAAYDGGHLPGAVFVDLDTVLSGPPSDAGGRQPLPDPAVFADGLAALGIGDGDTVVAYDDDRGAVAARLVWMLRVTGHDAALLEGGIGAWDGPLERDAPVRAPAAFTPRAWPEAHLAGIDDAASPATITIDAREAGRFRGDPDPYDPRAGHIPGSRSLPSRDHVGPGGRVLDPAALRERFAAVGIVPGAPGDVVSSCGAGVTACLNLLVMEHAGVGRGRLFPGSWSQYSRDPSRPVATGPG